MRKESRHILESVKRLRPNSIFMAILVSMVAMSIICIAILSAFFTEKIIRENQENLNDVNQSHLDVVAGNADYLVGTTLHQSIVQLSYSHSILSLATSQTASNSDINTAASDISFANKYNTLISSVILYYSEKNAVYLSDYSKYTLEEYPNQEMIAAYTDGEIEETTIKRNSKITTFFSYGGSWYLAFDFPLYGDSRLATLFYEINMDELYSYIQDNDLSDSEIWVYDQQNEPVFDTGSSYPEEITGEWLESNKAAEGDVTTENPEYVFLSVSDTLGWSYVYIADAGYFSVSITDVLKVVLPVILIALCISLAGSYGVALLLYRPFGKLIEQVSGRMQTEEPAEKAMGEFDYLNLAFSDMKERNQRLRDMMVQVSEDVTTRLFMELFMNRQHSYSYVEETLKSVESPFQMSASYVSCVVHCGKELAQDVRLRGEIRSELQAVMKEYDGKGRILYHIVYAEGQSFGIILSFAVNESVLSMKRSIVEIGELIQARMDRMQVPVRFASGNIYHSIMDVGFSYAEAYRSLSGEPDRQRKPEKEESPDQEKRQTKAADEVKVIEDDIVLRIQHAISMVQLDNTEAAQELLRRVLEDGMNLCGDASEKRQYYDRFVHAFSDELVKMKNINIAAFPSELFSEKEDAPASEDDEAILEYA
ncbi:MAG: hypothetical protein LUF35_14340 [Lachnospiraceae bacterium]|nr:hypothetical protein [Lachnospiraceae bacterium]